MVWGMGRLSWIFAFLLVLQAGAGAATLEDIKARGVVNCGVEAVRPGVSEMLDGQRVGLAVALCRVLAAGILGRAEATALVVVDGAEAAAALQAGEVDVLLQAQPWRFSYEVEQGLLHAVPLFFHPGEEKAFGPIVRQGDDSWLVAVRWMLVTLNGAARPLAPEHGAAGVQLGFSPDWMQTITAVAADFEALVQPYQAKLAAAGWVPAAALR
jgi:ABC-type amino acid transport substrate-binding protein